MRQLAEEVIKRVDPAVKIQHVPYQEVYGDNFEDVNRRVPDVTRLRETIGTSPSMPLGDLLDDIIAAKRSA